MNFIRFFFSSFLLITCLVWLTACSTNTDYLESSTLPPIDPPEDLDKDRLGELYPVPDLSDKRSPKKFSVPFPPTVGTQDDANVASWQTMSEQSWVLNAKAPATTWTQLLNFFQTRQIPVAKRDLSSATMTTGWFGEALQAGYLVRYQLRLEQGLQPDTTEVFITNQKTQASLPEFESETLGQDFQSLADPNHGKWLADQLVAEFNKKNEGIGDSYLATTIDLPQKVRLTEHDGEPILSSIASEARLNRALSKALDENDLIVYGRDLAQDVYYFNQIKEDGSWLNLFSWQVFQTPTKERATPIEKVLARLPDESEVNALFPNAEQRKGQKKTSGLPGFLLVMRSQENKTTIYLRDAHGRVLPADEAIVLLDTIRLRLI